MCLSCGCGEPNNDHGDASNITMHDVENAASAAGISPMQAAQNVSSGAGTGR